MAVISHNSPKVPKIEQTALCNLNVCKQIPTGMADFQSPKLLELVQILKVYR